MNNSMANKSNQATPQRTEGDRMLDAPLVTMDLDLFIEKLRKEPSWKDSDRNSITIYKSGNLRIVLIGLHEGAAMKTHQANGMITVQVLEGHIRFTAAPETVELQKGNMLALHKNVAHSVLALK